VKRAWRRAAAAVLTAAFGGALGPACPSRDLAVQVTEAGSNEVVVACESFRDACTGTACHHNRFLCDQVSCHLREECTVGAGLTTWDPTLPMAAQMILLSATDPLRVEETGACLLLDLRGCIPALAGGCAPITVDGESCVAGVVSAAVAASIGPDLTFGGFTDPSSALLALAFFQVPGGATACGASPAIVPGVCASENLIGAAGFSPPVGGSVYDISCASCQAGELDSNGRDTGPCPTADGVCFAQRVGEALARAP
jgi:hypothetical protein